MSLRLLAAIAIAIGAACMASPVAFADEITIHHEVDDGTESPVSYTWLTVGSNRDGGGAEDKWRVAGVIDFTYNTAGDIIGASGTLDILEGGSVVGTVTFNDASFSDGDLDGNLLGSFDLTFDDIVTTSDFADYASDGDKVTIGFKDKSYYGTSFNEFSRDEISLWGNELIDYDLNGGANFTEAGNFGFDWHSTNVPEPGSIALLGLGLLGLAVARRRRRSRA